AARPRPPRGARIDRSRPRLLLAYFVGATVCSRFQVEAISFVTSSSAFSWRTSVARRGAFDTSSAEPPWLEFGGVLWPPGGSTTASFLGGRSTPALPDARSIFAFVSSFVVTGY